MADGPPMLLGWVITPVELATPLWARDVREP